MHAMPSSAKWVTAPWPKFTMPGFLSLEDGATKEEWKMMVETKKILDPTIKVSATCVRVPVFIGHAEAVNLEFENEMTVDQAREVAEYQAVLVAEP